MPPHPAPADPLCVLRGHGGDVQALAFCSGRPGLLYSGDSDGELRVWDLEDRRATCACRLHRPEGGILGLALPNPSTLVTQGRDGLVKVWELGSDGGVAGAPPPPPPGAPASAAAAGPPLTPARTLPVDSHSFCGLDVRVPAGWAGLRPEAPPAPPPESSPSSEQRLLAARPLALVAGADGASAEVWCLDAAAPLLRLVPPPRPGQANTGGRGGRGLVMAARFLGGGGPGGRGPLGALTAHEDGSLCLWALPSGGLGPPGAAPPSLTEPVSALTAHGDAPMAVAVAPTDAGGAVGVSGAADDLLCVFGVEGGGRTLTRRGAVRLPAPGVGAVAVRAAADRVLAAAVGWDGRTRLVGVGGGGGAGPTSALADLAYHAAPGSAAAFEPGGSLLATGGRDGAIALWDVAAVLEAAGG